VVNYGASGAVGTAALQLAKHFGAEVTVVCSARNLVLAKSLGADAVLDYTKEQAPSAGKHYDVFLDAVGKRKTSPLRAACLNALAPGGRAISVDDGLPKMSVSNLALLKDLVDAGKLRPVIDRRYLLEQIAEAHRCVEQDHKRGNVVITVRHAHASRKS
jgi:NADPH:quinone reductase-like Zn-dependent oxidoreductase